MPDLRAMRFLRWTLMLVDIICILLSLGLSYYLRFNVLVAFPLIDPDSRGGIKYAIIILGSVPLWIATFIGNQLYDPRKILGGIREYARVVSACTYATFGLLVFAFFVRELIVSRAWLLLVWVMSILFVWSWRFAARRIVHLLRRRGLLVTRVIIGGTSNEARALVEGLSQTDKTGVKVMGFIDDFMPVGAHVVGNYTVLGQPNEIERVMAESCADEVIIVPNALAWESVDDLMRKAASGVNGIELKIAPGFYEILATNVSLDERNYLPLLNIERVRLTGFSVFLKWIIDYGAGFLIAMLTLPLMLLSGCLVAIAHRGIIFDKSSVLGLAGRAFHTWRFHLETPRGLDGERDWAGGAATTSRFDRYIYRLGLDKLPQLASVLAGQMSLVGPRSIRQTRGEKYGAWLPTLLAVKPGVTGPWVVAGPTAKSVEDELKLDLYYVRNWSVWMDLQILLKTLRRLWRNERPWRDR